MKRFFAVENRKDLLFCITAFLIPYCAVMAVRLIFVRGGENSIDGFYHAGMALLGPEVFLAKEFPWTGISVWHDTFADKELLYHALLWIFFRIQQFFGFAATPPFHFPAGCILAMACAAWVYAGRSFRIPWRILCAGGLLFPLVAPNWCFRLVMLRPHVLSVAFFLLICGILSRKMPLKWRYILVALLSFFYCWSYSNPHFIVIPVLFFAVFQLFRDGWRVIFLPFVSLASVLAGLVIHPQFPHSFRIWKLQSWDALISPMLAAYELSRPTEMMPPGLIWLSMITPVVILFFVALYFLIRRIEKGGWRNADPEVMALAALSFLFLVGTFVAMRSIEYAAPLTVLLFLTLFHQALRDGFPLPGRAGGERRVLLLLLLLSVMIGGGSAVMTAADGRKAIRRPVYAMGDWLRANLKPGETVVNLDWSDFPILFYSNPDQHYLWGMDPIFAYAVKPAETRLLSASRVIGRRPPHYGEIGKTFGARYGVILYPRIPHAAHLAQYGWKLKQEFVSESGHVEGWLFALDEREAMTLPHMLIRKID